MKRLGGTTWGVQNPCKISVWDKLPSTGEFTGFLNHQQRAIFWYLLVFDHPMLEASAFGTPDWNTTRGGSDTTLAMAKEMGRKLPTLTAKWCTFCSTYHTGENGGCTTKSWEKFYKPLNVGSLWNWWCESYMPIASNIMLRTVGN